MIDGYVRVGFHVTLDPSLPGPYAGAIGQHSYDLGSVAVPKTDGGPTPTDFIPVRAVVRYPAQANGVDAAFKPGAFPLIVIMHGNSGMQTSYLGYNYLLDHLAGHGFVAMSIHVPPGVMIETRARAILHHLSVMSQNNTAPGLFHNHIDFTKVGIAGHSRGGELVVRAARINTSEGLGLEHQGRHLDRADLLQSLRRSRRAAARRRLQRRRCVGSLACTAPASSSTTRLAGRARSCSCTAGPTTVSTPSGRASKPSVELPARDRRQRPSQADLAQRSRERGEGVRHGVPPARTCKSKTGGDGVDFTTGLRPSLASGLSHPHVASGAGRACCSTTSSSTNRGQNTLGGSVSTASLPCGTRRGPAAHALDAALASRHRGRLDRVECGAGRYLPQSWCPAAQQGRLRFQGSVVPGDAEVRQRVAIPPARRRTSPVRLERPQRNKSRAIRVERLHRHSRIPYERGFATRIKSALKSVRVPLEFLYDREPRQGEGRP